MGSMLPVGRMGGVLDETGGENAGVKRAAEGWPPHFLKTLSVVRYPKDWSWAIPWRRLEKMKMGSLELWRVLPQTVNLVPRGKQSWFESRAAHH